MPNPRASTSAYGPDDAEEVAATVTALNPEAGHHEVTDDPRELGAAMRAGEVSWSRFPYYEQRYGARGRGFNRSDSAWIVVVGQEPRGAAERQLRWLGALLAARGMPRWLLEVHLGALHTELLAAVPEKATAYERLLAVAEKLRVERFRHLDETTSLDLASAFDLLVGPALVAVLPEAGALLVASVADERAGVLNSVDSLTEWLSDPARFSAEWVAATNGTVAAARQLAL